MTVPPQTPPAAPGADVEIVGAEDLAGIESAWRALFVEAVEPNPFLGPDFLIPLAALRGGRLRVALAWRRAGGGRSLSALMPFVLEPGLPLLRPPLLRAFADPLVSNATPLIAAGRADEVAAVLLDGLARLHPGAVLLLDGIRLDGPAATALAATRPPSVDVARFERAAIRAGAGLDAYLEERVPGKRVRELRRCERRLAEAGPVTRETLWGAAARPAVEAFLALEASGWKGRQGTALASRPADLAFARAALSGATPAVAADLLTVAGRPVAAAVHLLAGDDAVAFKCAYDEAWAKASPGAVLDLHTLETVLGSGRIGLMDSGAQPGHPVEALWRERIAYGDRLVALDRRTASDELEALARRLAGLSAMASTAKGIVKRALGRKSTALRSA
ncbi:MAG TPA: GNAT family N-acetyltransferase [Salinarimonas sp.]|nr:GNAT family N-acetyltransferase [Salinarimonas sp.]